MAASTPFDNDKKASAGFDFKYGLTRGLFLFNNVTANAYYARTDSPGKTEGQESYRGRFEFMGDRYGATVEHLLIGAQFNYQNLRAQYSIDTQRKVSGRVFTAYGSLYNGKKTEAGYLRF